VEVLELNPKSLCPEIRVNSAGRRNDFSLHPLLLNKGDCIKIKALVNQMGELIVDGRVAGVKEIKKKVTEVTLDLRLLLFAALAGIVGGNLLYISTSARSPALAAAISIGASMVVGMTGLTIWWSIQRQR
jgi:hypothetical protein